MIKEARPFTGPGWAGEDAVCRLKREFTSLERIASTGIAPTPIDLFQEWEHWFLVESFVDGWSLADFSATRSPLLKTRATREDWARWYADCATLGKSLARAVASVHQCGLVVGDLSPGNVLVVPDSLDIRLVDLESACPIGSAVAVEIATPGYVPPNRTTGHPSAPERDYYALGSLLLHLVFPVNAVLELNPRAYERFLKAFSSDCDLPLPLRDLIGRLLDPDGSQRPTFDTVCSILDKVTGAGSRPSSTRGVVAAGEVQSLREEPRLIARFILGARDPSRDDRLFPCDPASPNPLNVAYGALGVVHVLLAIGAEPPEDVVRWVQRQPFDGTTYPPGLYVGLSGLAWVFAELGDLDRSNCAIQMALAHPLCGKSHDVFSGTAGVGMALLRLWQHTSDRRWLEMAGGLAERILDDAQRSHDGTLYWRNGRGSVPLGYAFGGAGVALFLLYLSCASGERQLLEAGAQALRHDLRSGREVEPGILSFPSEPSNGSTVYPYWLHGSAGIGTALVRYEHMMEDDAEFSTCLRGLVPDVSRKYAVFPGLFRGLAGLGNFLLDLAFIAGDDQAYRAAQRVAEGVLLFGIDRPEGRAFPGDDLYRISADFGTGCAGVAAFLHRLSEGGPNFNFVLDDLLST